MISILKIKTAVVILNWNGRKFLEKFLADVIKHTENDQTKVVVADNASTDDSISFLKQYFPETPLIILNKNHGFAEGYNRALKQIDAEYYVLLNSDIETTNNWLQPIVNQMDNNQLIGAAMPKIMAYNNKNSFEYAGAAGGFIDKFGYPFCRGRVFDTTELDEKQYDDSLEVFWASGAAMVLKAEAFWKAGMLDGDFFAHMEEIDLCWRMKNQGSSIWVFPETKVYHVGGGTLSNESPFKLFLNFRNNLILLYKNLPATTLVPVLLFRMVLDGVAALQYLLKGKFSLFLAVFRAHLNFYKTLPKTHKKRKVQKKFIKNSHIGIYNKSIVFNYFIRNKRNFSNLDF